MAAIDATALGRRVSIRRQVAGGLTDVVGHLVGETPETLTVLRATGEVVTLDRASVTAAKVIPRAPVRRGWEVPAVTPAQLQRICWAGWPAREVEMLGDWALRAHRGVTGRANSAMAIGDPGCPLPTALEAVTAFYAKRSLPPLLQLPLADPVNLAMAEQGWAQVHVTIVKVAPIEPLIERVSVPHVLRSVVRSTPSAEWLSLMHDLDERDTDAHVEILTGPPVVGFATVYRRVDGSEEEPVGIGRVSVEGEWAGVTSVDVAPAARRRGVGSAVMRTLLAWAGEHGARSTYLQVRVANDAALRLYAALGYVTHHPYTYRSPAPPREGQGV